MGIVYKEGGGFPFDSPFDEYHGITEDGSQSNLHEERNQYSRSDKSNLHEERNQDSRSDKSNPSNEILALANKKLEEQKQENEKKYEKPVLKINFIKKKQIRKNLF